MNRPIDLTGRVVAVTGAGRGLGRSYALALAGRGASLVVNDLGSTLDGRGADQSTAADVVDSILSAGGRAVADHSDVSTRDGADSVVRRAVDHFGRIDAVIANAGISTRPAPFAETARETLDRMLRTHVGGSWGLAQAAWPHFVAQGRGRILLTTSGAIAGHPNGSAYATAKAAILGLTRTLALEGTAHGIVVNAIAPMAFTRMAQAEHGASAAMERALPPESVASAAVALTSDEWTMTGEVFIVGGGLVDRIYLVQGVGLTLDPGWPPEVMIEHARRLLDHESVHLLIDSAATAARLRI